MASQLISTLPLLLLLVPAVSAAGGGGPEAAPAPTPAVPCLWKVCDQIRMPNPRDGAVLEIYNCDFAPGGGLGAQLAKPGPCSAPRDIANLHRVRFDFRMNDVGLRVFPTPLLCPFERLGVLDLQRNRLAALPADFPARCLPNMKRLRLSANRLTRLDLSPLLALAALEELDVEDNLLDTIFLSRPPPPNATTRLRVIRAARSRLKTVDLSLARLASLTLLDLSRNRVGRISNRLGWNWRSGAAAVNAQRRKFAIAGRLGPNYRYRLEIRLRANHFAGGFREGRMWGVDVGVGLSRREAVLNALLDLQRLFGFVHADLGGARLDCDCHAEGVLLFLQRYLTPRRRAQVGIGAAMGPLLGLKCERPRDLRPRTLLTLNRRDLYCRRRTDCPAQCVCTEFMNVSYVGVDCRRAALTSLPAQLPVPLQPEATYQLQLDGNSIAALPGPAPTYAHRVSRLSLRRNNISALEPLAAVLRHFRRLSVLDLSENPIRSLSPALLNLSASKDAPDVVRLSVDRLDCRCDYFRLSALRQVLRLLPNLYDRHCRFEEQRWSFAAFRDRHCRRYRPQGGPRPPDQNGTSAEDHRSSPPPTLVPDNEWLLAVVASGAAVIIVALLVITAVILVRYWRRDRHLKAARRASRPGLVRLEPPQPTLTPPGASLGPPSPTAGGPMENPYAEYRLSFLDGHGAPAPGPTDDGDVGSDEVFDECPAEAYRVATVHPRVPSKVSLRRCEEEEEEREKLVKPRPNGSGGPGGAKPPSVDLNGNTHAPGGLAHRQRSAPRLYFDDEEDEEERQRPGRRLRPAASMPKVPPLPPPRGNSTLSRQGSVGPLLSPSVQPLETDL